MAQQTCMKTNWRLRINEEIFPFIAYYNNKRKICNEIIDPQILSNKECYNFYYKLTEDDLINRISQEHDRAKSMDDKTSKMTLAISLGITIIGVTSSILTKQMEYDIIKILTTLFSLLSVFYSMAAGCTAIGALKTLPTYGYGTKYIYKSKTNGIPYFVHALAAQEKMNNVRHLRNESAYQSIRNSIILLLFAFYSYFIDLIYSSFEKVGVLFS